LFFYSHEKKLQEAKHKLSEAEKVGENLSELKVALQELQQEEDKIKQKEDEIKKKEKVCMCSVIYVCVPKLIIMQIQANMKTSCTIAGKYLAGSSLLYCLHVMIMVGTVVYYFSYRTSGYISEIQHLWPYMMLSLHVDSIINGMQKSSHFFFQVCELT
jgi:uncharacterized membrane protein (DUF106 family)